jgi:hypothetical protein
MPATITVRPEDLDPGPIGAITVRPEDLDAAPDDPIHSQAKTAEELPTPAAFDASHQAAVKSLWQKAKDFASSAAAVGEAAAPIALKKGEQLANEPLVPESVMPGPATTPAGAVGRSALEFARGMTSPENIAIGALAGPFGKIAPLLGRAVSAGFGLQMLKGAYDKYPEIRDAINKKDWTRAAGAITTAALSGGLGVLAGTHAVRGGGPETPLPAETSPIEKATESARAGVEALAVRPEDLDQAAAPQGAPTPEAAGPAPLIVRPEELDAPAPAPTSASTAPPVVSPDALDSPTPQPTARLLTPVAPLIAQPEELDQPGAQQPAAPGAGNIPAANTPAPGPPKPLWEMSPDELDTAAADAKGRDQADLQDLFGPDGAKQYTRLERAANSTMKSQQETAAASDQLEQMEAGLTQEQRNRLYGVGDDRPQLDDIRSYQQALGRVDTSSPEALGESLKWAVTGVGDKDNPAEMTPDEQLRYAQLRHGMSEASAQGWDPVEVSQAAFRGAAGRFQSPEDAAFMLRRFAQPEGQPVADTAASTPGELSVRPALGRDTKVLVPGETTTYPARYAVRELADVQPSHNAFNFQPNPDYEYTNDRDYSRKGNAARVVQNAAPDTFNPDYPTADSPTAEHGAPIIDSSGNVLGGNSRTMTLARVYQRGGPDAELYKQAIATKAAQFGIDPAELDRFDKPVLVRELGGGIDSQRAISDFDKAAPAALSPEEEAVSDGRRISSGTIQDIAGRLDDLGEEGTLASALRGDDGAAVLNRLVNDGVLTEQEKGGYLDDRGNLTTEAKSRIGKALVGRLFDNPAEFRETTPAVRAKLERIAPQLLRVEGRPDWSLTDATRQAIALSEDARVHKIPIEDAAQQAVIGADRGYTPEAVDVAKTLEQGPVKAAGAFRRYANDEALSREGSQGAFFTPPTRAEAFDDAFRVPNTIARVKMSERGSAPMLSDLAQLGAHYLRRGVEVFSDWSGRMVEAIGDWVRPYLMRAFVAARKVLSDERGSWSNKPADQQSGSLFGSEEDQRTAQESALDRDKLQGERLTAQFNAPVSREEQLRQLRAAPKPPQTDLFEATPDKSQFSLFGPDHPEREPREPAIVDTPDQQRIRNSIREGEMRQESGRDSLGKKLSQGQLDAIAGSVESSKARLAEQVKADSARYGGEHGGINPNLLSLGAGKFVQEDVIPAAKRVASDLVEARDDIMRVVAPQTRGSAAEFTGLNLRQRMAQFARRFDQGEQRLRDARRFFNTRAPEDNYRFIDNVERGLGRGAKPGDAELEPIARMFSKMLDQRRSEVQALGEGALKGFYQNYFPHIFERPEQASRFIDSFFSGKRSMEGPKSFLQHREFPTFREALDAGLKPVSDNPVDLVMIKAREMDRYLLAHAVLRDLAENGIAKRVSGLGPDARQAEMLGGSPVRPEWAVEKKTDLPPDFVSIRDPVGGGKWYASEGAADVLNNFLSPGLRGRSGLFRTLLGVNNTMNQANLGLSAFHLRAVSISAMAGRMGLGMVKAMEGHPLDAAFHIFTSPAAPFIDFVKGSKVLHDWFKPGSEGAPIAAMTDALMKGGGRAKMDAFYQNAMADKMMTAFRRGNYIGGAIRSPFAAIETMAKPLMNYLVPRMKIGAFADMAQHEMEKLGPGAKVVDVQRAMSAAWDHVENRLGQMTYDNRFWNRTFKDIAMLSVRSVGWNLGDFLEGKSAIGAVKQMATLKKPADLHGLGFVVGYTATAALMGAVMQYLHTGKGPQQLEDYFFPKREDGRRVVSAPYVKDAYQFVRDPARTLENKASPLISTMSQMVHNRDYYDHPIRNVDAPLVKQLQQEAEYVGRQFLPFTLQPYAGNSQKRPTPLAGGNTPEHKVENFLGVTAAPAPLQPVTRNSNGRIARSSAAIRAFREDHPCPSTGSTRGGCLGYVVDHFRSLKHGGNDEPSNMQWQKMTEAMAKDRTE